jgi:hypothetical protein
MEETSFILILLVIIYNATELLGLKNNLLFLFSKGLFRTIVLLIIAYQATRDIRVALLLSIGYLLSMDKYQLWENKSEQQDIIIESFENTTVTNNTSDNETGIDLNFTQKSI